MRDPIETFCKSVYAHTGGRDTGVGSVYEEALAKKARIAEKLRDAVAQPDVQMALQLELESDVLLSKMDGLLEPFSKV